MDNADGITQLILVLTKVIYTLTSLQINYIIMLIVLNLHKLKEYLLKILQIITVPVQPHGSPIVADGQFNDLEDAIFQSNKTSRHTEIENMTHADFQGNIVT